MYDVIVIGAGVAGLAAARHLRAAGGRVLVLERARGVGGRCATRRVDGRPVDFGTPFLHGRTPEFLEAVAAVSGGRPVPGWPRVRDGTGTPCQPEAFDGLAHPLAFREGMSAFPKHLARGLELRLCAEAQAVVPAATDAGLHGAGVEVIVASSRERLLARAVLLTMPIPHARRLLGPLLRTAASLARALPALEQVRTVPCLTVFAGYAAGTPRPAWDMSLPETGRAIHSILNDSSKREVEAPLVLVIQAAPAYSRAWLDRPAGEWERELLREAGELHGRWIESPAWRQSHRWEHARVLRPTELASPLVLELEGGGILGLCGDAFSSAGGIEGAYLSGVAVASRVQQRLARPGLQIPGGIT